MRGGREGGRGGGGREGGKEGERERGKGGEDVCGCISRSPLTLLSCV